MIGTRLSHFEITSKLGYHFDLLDSELIERHLEWLVQNVRYRRAG